MHNHFFWLRYKGTTEAKQCLVQDPLVFLATQSSFRLGEINNASGETKSQREAKTGRLTLPCLESSVGLQNKVSEKGVTQYKMEVLLGAVVLKPVGAPLLN